MELVEIVRRAWGWTGIEPVQVVGTNDFGNLMIKDQGGKYWRMCPEDLSCEVVANTRAQLNALSQDQEFLQDWYMSSIVQEARRLLGALKPGFKYCLEIPGVLGGEYGGKNLGTMPLVELIASSGDIAQQIEGLPDGAKVDFKIVE